MKTVKKVSFATLGVLGLAMPITYASRQEPVIKPGVTVVGVRVGGMTADDARKKLRVWWEGQKLTPVVLRSTVVKSLPPMTPGQLGVALNDELTVEGLPRATLIEQAAEATNQTAEATEFPVKFKVVGKPQARLAQAIETSSPAPKEATVRYDHGQILINKESPIYKTDLSSVGELVAASLSTNLSQGLPATVDLPTKVAPKRVPDEQLAQIREVVSSYTTSFPVKNKPRSINLALAASKFHGVLVMPGETVSYNDVVGERTAARGYKAAGVFVNGRLDSGLGGGICQVSSTLYNAALLANLRVVERQNHSVAVVYVPLGRDSTVSYGSIDLKIRNTGNSAIAIDSECHPGRLTFRILGKKDPGLAVSIEKAQESFRPVSVQTRRDPSLPSGTTKVVEKGTPRRSVVTFRVVSKGGQVVKRERLGTSTYGGLPTVVAVGTKSAPGPTALLGSD